MKVVSESILPLAERLSQNRNKAAFVVKTVLLDVSLNRWHPDMIFGQLQLGSKAFELDSCIFGDG